MIPADLPRLPIRRALLSVSDKTGLVELARFLADAGVELLSTGGSATALRAAGLAVTDVAAITGFPEIMGGRVKTLHPRIHGGLLHRGETDRAVMTEHGIAAIDLLVANLYPFEATVARPDCDLAAAVEEIDIGGPAMVRAAAKNFAHVAVLTDPGQYPAVLEELAGNAGTLSGASRWRLAVEAFNRISNYDAAISDHLSSLAADGTRSAFPAQANGRFVKVMDLRYGENPHQQAAFYRDLWPVPGTLATFRQLQGKELSYNNLADADAAWECVRQFERPACVIVKHANPCGVAQAADLAEAYALAFATDPTSSFGGIIAVNRELDEAAARAMTAQFLEVLIAPSVSQAARAVLARKGNVRVLEIPPGEGLNNRDVKRVGSGLLMQDADVRTVGRDQLRVVTRAQPAAAQLDDLMFAWRVARFVKSNAIVYAGNGRTLGIGAGQMSRVDSARIAALKAQGAGLDLAGCAVASDAFFPFRDGLDVLADAGAACVIQPGGSIRDEEVVAAADERGVAMVFTGMRHFRH
ncbi:MAG: bifunctional phosphoribosylaminoimidazolecarboxamide formyltransferase/IMP cyclohydrolase [Xanthomonadales bacterium]|nr:bifunctional phosphoribosylaminoimidazolecarboxamide formyltransferase/IMP cyclohydrolase [Xanthomonadales bacterium]